MAWLAAMSACGGVSPVPEELAERLPEHVELSAAEARQVEDLTAAALTSVRSGDFQAARRAAEEALALDPRVARAIAVRARCRMEEARVDEPPELHAWRRAEGELRLAQRLRPNDPEIGLLHADFLEADGHLSAAADAADRVLEHAPEHVEALRRASRLRYELGEERLALPLLERLLELDPGDDAARYRVARSRLRLALTGAREQADDAAKIELFEQAAAAFRDYQQSAPADAEGFAGEATARYEILRLRGAAQVSATEVTAIAALFARASDLGPASPESEFGRGVVLELSGDAEGARSAYESALNRDPEHLPSLLNLAANLAEAGRTDEAKACCERALSLTPTPSERRKLERFLAQ